jgi:hypothetical protein
MSNYAEPHRTALSDFNNDDQPQEQDLEGNGDDDIVRSYRCDVCFKIFDSYKMACMHEEKCVGEGEAPNNADSDDVRKRNGKSWTWIQQDYVDLERLIEEATGRPIDWGRIASQMNPIRTAAACKITANKMGISVPKKDADGRKRNGSGIWIQQDHDDLKRLVGEATDPIDWDAIGRQMNPIRTSSACRSSASKRGIYVVQQQDDDDGRKLNGGGWTWIQQDYNALKQLVAATEDPVDWDAIGRQMSPVRSASACKSAAKKMKNYERVEIPPPPAKKPRVE